MVGSGPVGSGLVGSGPVGSCNDHYSHGNFSRFPALLTLISYLLGCMVWLVVVVVISGGC